MVTRLKTGVGGTVGPQGGAIISTPASNAANRSQSVPMEGVYAPSPSASPFALYNFAQDGGGNLLGRGTSGNDFRAVKTGGYWDNSNHEAGYANLAPQYNALADFGGSWCSGVLTAIIKTSSLSAATEVQWVMSDGAAWSGISINTQVDLSFPYISMSMAWRGVSAPTYTTTAYWDLTTATLTTANLFILTLTPGTTTHSLLINGSAFSAGTSHANDAPSCATFNGGTYPAPEMATDVFNATAITGMAWTRSAADNAYWSAYDWATHPGFAP